MIALALSAIAEHSIAATVSISRSSRLITEAEVADGVAAGSFIHDFYVTSDTDILSVCEVVIDTPLFQHTLGSDVAMPNAAAIASRPGLAADSFITLPGSTSSIGGGFSSSPGDHTWFDISDDGLQGNFNFARLSVSQTGLFSGYIAVKGAGSFVSLPFEFLLPGNESDMALLAGEQTYAMEYPHVAPPVEPLPTIPTPPATNPDPVRPRFPSEPPLVETPPEVPPIVVTPVDPPASDPPTQPAEPVDPLILIESPLVFRPIEWLIDPIDIDIDFAVPNWRLGDVDGGMPTWVDLREWHINNVYTLGDGTAMLLPSVGFFAYDGATSGGISLGELRLSGNTFDTGALTALMAAAAEDSVIPEPATGLLAAVALIALRATRRRSP